MNRSRLSLLRSGGWIGAWMALFACTRTGFPEQLLLSPHILALLPDTLRLIGPTDCPYRQAAQR